MHKLPSNSTIKNTLIKLSQDLNKSFDYMTPKDIINMMNEIERQCTEIVIEQAQNGNNDFKDIKNILDTNIDLLNKEKYSILWNFFIVLWLEKVKKTTIGVDPNKRDFKTIKKNKEGLSVDSENNPIRHCIYNSNGELIKTFIPGSLSPEEKKEVISFIKNGNKFKIEKPFVYVEDEYTEKEAKSHFFDKARKLSLICLALADFFEDKEKEIDDTGEKKDKKEVFSTKSVKLVFDYISKVGYVPSFDNITNDLNMSRTTVSKAKKELIKLNLWPEK